MDTSLHTMKNLFLQLGLDNTEASIEHFISHHQLRGNERLEQASFWTAAQSAFIEECLTDDSDWVEVVDHLNAQLQK